MNQQFKVEDIVGSATGILIGKIGGIYAVLSHLAGRPVFTHEIPVLSRRASELIYFEHPELAEEYPPKGDPDKIPAYVEMLISKYGAELPLPHGVMSTEGSHALLAGKHVIVVVDGKVQADGN